MGGTVPADVTALTGVTALADAAGIPAAAGTGSGTRPAVSAALAGDAVSTARSASAPCPGIQITMTNTPSKVIAAEMKIGRAHV